MKKDDRHILVTGAGGALGGALVEYLLNNGFTNISCQYRDNEGVLPKLFGDKFELYCFKADLTDEKQVINLHDWILKLGPIYGLVNLAGASTNSMSWKMSKQEFLSIIDANLMTTFLTCKEFIPEMRNQGFGRIINTSSIVAFTGAIGASHYCAAKAGIAGLTRALSLELANKNITSNVLALGYFDKGLITHIDEKTQENIVSKIPLKHFGHTNELGGQVKFLLSDDASYITGQTIHVNGGLYL